MPNPLSRANRGRRVLFVPETLDSDVTEQPSPHWPRTLVQPRVPTLTPDAPAMTQLNPTKKSVN